MASWHGPGLDHATSAARLRGSGQAEPWPPSLPAKPGAVLTLTLTLTVLPACVCALLPEWFPTSLSGFPLGWG
jgi:hypothetical protein